jgi:hypothetical protein
METMERQQTFEEFRQQVTGPKREKKRVTGSIGVYDIYKKLRKKGWLNIGRPLTEKEFYSIIRKTNQYLAKEIAMGRTIKFPARMGMLELRKQKNGVSIVKDKLKISYPINWNETLRLWYDDPEAMRNKVLMRDEEKYTYRVKYEPFDATYENKCFYQFALNTFIRRELKKNIKDGKVDTAWCMNNRN